MTQDEFQKIISDIHRAASQHGIDLADSSNTFTVWMEDPKGSREYYAHARAASLVQAMGLAQAKEAIICRTDIGRIQIIVCKTPQWFYS